MHGAKNQSAAMTPTPLNASPNLGKYQGDEKLAKGIGQTEPNPSGPRTVRHKGTATQGPQKLCAARDRGPSHGPKTGQ